MIPVIGFLEQVVCVLVLTGHCCVCFLQFLLSGGLCLGAHWTLGSHGLHGDGPLCRLHCIRQVLTLNILLILHQDHHDYHHCHHTQAAESKSIDASPLRAPPL